jgi:hypothetical protein
MYEIGISIILVTMSINMLIITYIINRLTRKMDQLDRRFDLLDPYGPPYHPMCRIGFSKEGE